MTKFDKRILIGFGIAAIIAIGAIAGFVVVLGRSFDASFKPVTDVSRYSEIKAGWTSNLVSHFPSETPDSAAFYFQPGFLQGGSSLQIKVAMTHPEIAAVLNKFTNRIVATYHQGGDLNDHWNLTNRIPTTSFFTSETESTTFPEDYTIMVIEAHDRNGGFAWNHGSTAGFAVSTQRNSVVYWAEDW